MRIKMWICLGITMTAFNSANAGLTKDEAQKMMNKAGCGACHAIDMDKIGPAYKDVAAFYRGPTEPAKAVLKGQPTLDYVMAKVRKGTRPDNRNWKKSKDGKKTYGTMTPNTVGKISDDDLKKLIEFILSL